MTTVEALKQVYVSLGGKLTDTHDAIANGAPVSDYNVIPDIIAVIALKSSGAIELPSVTTTDAGKVLTVNSSGAWDAEEPEAPFKIVEATSNGSTITFSNETQKSLYQYATSGKFLIVFDKTKSCMYICYGRPSGSISTVFVEFLCIERESDKTRYFVFSCLSNSTSNSTTIRSYSSDDYGGGSGPT